MKFAKYKCGHCGSRFIADTRRWHMDTCPGCTETAVDMEESYTRLIGSHSGKFPVFEEEFIPPWFDDEDMYHSALLTWLNDSSEYYELRKEEDGTLIILRDDLKWKK